MLFLFLFVLGCKKEAKEKPVAVTSEINTTKEFDKRKWNEKAGKDYPYRDDMVDDLIANQHLKELKRNEVIDLLGEPDRIDSLYLFYKISQERLGSWPLHTKTLVIKLSQDGTIDWIKIHK
jgi:hypothetical protein